MADEATWPVGWGRRLHPRPEDGQLEPVHGSVLFPAELAHVDRPYLVLNMVATADGRATVGGTPEGLGSPTDQYLMRRLRAEADAVLNGAGTLRADRFSPRVPADLAEERVARGQPPQPIGIVISARGRVDPDHPYFTSATEAWRRLIYTAGEVDPALAARPGVEVRRSEGGQVDLRQMLRELVERGIHRVVCEGGPTLNGELLAVGAVDDLFLTVAPRFAGDPNGLPIVAGPAYTPPPVRLRSLYEREEDLFFRYGVG